MQEAPFPSNEAERISALRGYDLLDTLPERAYDDISYIASQICGTPIALVSLVDSDRQWFKAKVGIDAPETPRNVAFCAHAILQPDELFVVEDASQDDRFVDNPLVSQDPNIRFYAGAPLVTSEGLGLGTLCVIDRRPRTLDAAQSSALRALARQVMAQLELRQAVAALTRTTEDLAESQTALEHSNRDLERFAYVAAHDLKEPLRMIGSFTDLLAESIDERLTSDEREYFHYIKDGAARGQAMTQDILEYSRLEQSDERDWVDLDALARNRADTWRLGADGVRIVIDGTLPRVWGSTALIERLLDNLVGNGLKYNESVTPAITISAAVVGATCEVRVADNGLGIKAEFTRKIFDMFGRVHDRSRYEGTGIGLAICRRVMELHSGRIDVESTVGMGSVFICSFPYSDEESGTHDANYDLAG